VSSAAAEPATSTQIAARILFSIAFPSTDSFEQGSDDGLEAPGRGTFAIAA
jgi:hypothetical protein